MVACGTRAVVLAAGRSKRFRRQKSKLLSKICGRPMFLFPLKVLEEFSIPTTLVLGYQADEIKQEVKKSQVKNVTSVLQAEMLGTGNALLCSQEYWDQEDILVLNADVPLLTPKLIDDLLEKHKSANASLSFVSTFPLNPKGYGRVITENGHVRIVEEKDCSEELRYIDKVNAGIYVIKKSFLQESIHKLKKSSVSGELYLTDLVALASDQGLTVLDVPVHFDQVRGVNTLQELWAVEQIMRSNLIKHWMKNGVRFELAQSIHIDIDVEIGADSFIGTGVHILGNTKIGEGCLISAFSILEDCIIGEDTMVYSHSVIQNSTIGDQAKIGPFARLRNNAVIADNVSIGNFVEVKNSSIANNSKAKHLSYLGDAALGENVNIGAGTIFCNYDGFQKHRTIIEDDVFIGSNNTIVAPVKLGKGSYAAAGSTITKNVPEQDLAIARARQENKEGYAKKLKKKGSSSAGSICKENEHLRIKNELKFHFLGAVKTNNGPEEQV